MKKFIISATLALFCIGLEAIAQSAYPGQNESAMRVTSPVSTAVKAFDLKDVRLLPGRMHDNLRRDSAWIMSIPVERLVHSFRNNSGVFASREGGYMTVKKLGGWESLDCDLRGHSTGHILSGCALLHAATGDDIFRLKGDSIVAVLAEVQQALGNGYLSAFPEELINRNIAGKSVWAPWYTLHKILAGLLDQYLYSNNTQALEIARGMGDWAYTKLIGLPDETRARMLRNEFGGINEAFYNLYAITGDDRYRQLARFFYHTDVIDPLAEPHADMGTRHTNTFIPKVLGEIRNYELSGDERSAEIACNFWNLMTQSHCFATGECSDKEHFFDPAKMANHISGYTGETCCTYNMLKLTKHLFCLEPTADKADFYERALYNHILGQQDPQSGMVCYFLPLLSGAYKVYSTPFDSFWCCVGSGFESHAKYAEAIYFHSDDELYVNLFIPSELTWRNKGLTLTQSTSFPESDKSILSIAAENPVRATLKIRYPSWCEGMEIKINGHRQRIGATGGEYVALSHTWRNGDRVEISIPMRFTYEHVAGNDSLRAIKYGPIIMAGQLGDEAMAPFSNPTKYNDYYTYDYHIPAGLPTQLDIPENSLDSSLVRQDSSLTFRLPDGRLIRPLYDTHHTRYVVYWNR